MCILHEKLKDLWRKPFYSQLIPDIIFNILPLPFIQSKLLVAETVFKEDIRNTFFTTETIGNQDRQT